MGTLYLCTQGYEMAAEGVLQEAKIEAAVPLPHISSFSMEKRTAGCLNSGEVAMRQPRLAEVGT